MFLGVAHSSFYIKYIRLFSKYEAYLFLIFITLSYRNTWNSFYSTTLLYYIGGNIFFLFTTRWRI